MVSSSSAKVQSSSSSIEYGTLIYGGQTYKTVRIGTQTWMAENLNYVVDSSWCYPNSADNCAKYGRLYTWTAAMNIDSSYQSTIASAMITTPHQGVCPAGWHIPTDAEWTRLKNVVGGSSVVGAKLKSASGWVDRYGNGTDAYGFSALPAGGRSSGVFCDLGYDAYFWSATEISKLNAYTRGLVYFNDHMYSVNSYKNDAFSVRCLKD